MSRGIEIDIRAAEGCDQDVFLLWDTIWNPHTGEGDWTLAGADEPLNVGGLSAKRALDTAIVLALFTDRRMPQGHPLTYLADGDPRGWWGDAVDVRADLHETELGSLLWVLERAPLTLPGGVPMTMWAERLALEALDPLRAQGIVVRIEATATANELKSRLELIVRMYGRDGVLAYDDRFELYWQQLQQNVPASLPPPAPAPVPPGPFSGPSLDFSNPNNSQYLGII